MRQRLGFQHLSTLQHSGCAAPPRHISALPPPGAGAATATVMQRVVNQPPPSRRVHSSTLLAAAYPPLFAHASPSSSSPCCSSSSSFLASSSPRYGLLNAPPAHPQPRRNTRAAETRTPRILTCAASTGPPPRAPVLEPSRLVSALDKLARAGRAPEPHWLDMYLAACQPMLSMLPAGDLATLARSLGRLGLAPQVPLAWAQALLAAVDGALPAAAVADDVAELLTWMAADERLRPGPATVGAALQQIQVLALEGGPLGHLSSDRAADAAWAVARLGYRPADPVLDCLAAATIGVPYRNLLRGHRRGGDLRDEDEDEGGGGGLPVGRPGGMATLPPEQVTRLAWAFASFNYFPTDEWAQAYLLEGIWRRGLSPEGATAVLWSLGCMQLPAEGLWLQNYYLTTTGRLREVPAEGLVNAMWAIAVYGEVLAAGISRAVQDEQGGAEGEASRDSEAGPSQRTPPLDDLASPALAAMYEGAAVAQIEQQLEALLSLGSRGTPEQQEAVAKLREALRRRLAGRTAGEGGGDGDPAGAAAAEDALVPAGWASEWYDALVPYIDSFGSVALVKTLWALSSLELQPPPPSAWLRQLLATATVVLLPDGRAPAPESGALELLYASRSADALLQQRRAAAAARLRSSSPSPASAGASTGRQGPVQGSGVGVAQGGAVVGAEAAGGKWDEAEEIRLMEALSCFAAESFARLGRQQLPPGWRRLNPRFPPYAQPRPGAEGEAGAGPEAPARGADVGRALVGPVPPRPGGGVLRPFR